MTPDERQMIEDLFDRLSAERPQSKDRQADALIRDLVRDIPDAAYMLVQTVLVYEHQLQVAAERIQNLEAEYDDRASSNSAAGSFLSGRIGSGSGAGQSGRPAAVRSSNEYRKEATSVPSVGGAEDRAVKGPATARAQGTGDPPRAGGGGFFRSAMATAAGVAGGMLAADGLRSLFGGATSEHASDTQKASTESANQTDPGANHDAAPQEPVSHDDGDQDWGLGDVFGGDLDI